MKFPSEEYVRTWLADELVHVVLDHGPQDREYLKDYFARRMREWFRGYLELDGEKLEDDEED